MAQTIVKPFGKGDDRTHKRWSADLLTDQGKKSYFNKKFVGTSDNAIIQRKTELESDAGDLISFDLSVHLRGKPTVGDDRLKGKEENLKFYTDEVRIDQTRKSVSAGGRMTRKRTDHDLRTVAKDRLSEYWAQYIDELFFIYLGGARGINEDFIEDTDWAGHASNPIQPPDTGHILFGGSATSKATITVADKMSRTLIERAATRTRMMKAEDPKQVSMMPVSIEGEPHYVCLMSPFQEYDLRTAEGTNGWLDIAKAAATAEGRNSPIFKGGLGMINNIVLHSHESVIRFSDYGAGGDVRAARALVMGRQAGVVAHGTAGATTFSWKEEVDDYGNEPVVAAGTIIGVKKTRFNGKDFGILALDTAARSPEGA